MKPQTFTDVRYTDSKGRDCERYAPRIKVSQRSPGYSRGWNWYAPYDKLNKCFLAEPFYGRVKSLSPRGDFGSHIPGVVWDWLRKTTIKEYEQHTDAARWEKEQKRRKVAAVEKKLDRGAE